MNITEIPGGLAGLAGNQQAGIVGSALASLENGQLNQVISQSAQELDPEHRGQIMETLLKGIGSSGSDVSSILGQLGVNSQVIEDPQAATPEELAAVSAHAQANHPDIFHQAMAFYEEHPTLVKTLGVAAVALITKHVADRASA